MSFGETAVLGALAGFTIFLGLPFGRLHLLSGTRAGRPRDVRQSACSAFLFVDVFEHAFEIVEDAVVGTRTRTAACSRPRCSR